MDICEKYQLQFVPAVIGTKAIIQGDGIAEDFQQYAAGVVPTTGWTIAGATATAWMKTKAVAGNIVGEFSDADGASSLSGIFAFAIPSTNPIGLRTWASFDATPITISVNDVHANVRNTGGATTYMRIKFLVGGNIVAATGAGDIVLIPWVSGTKYHVQVIVVSASTFDVVMNNVLYDNAGAHYTCITNWSTSDIGQIQFVNNAVAGLWNVYVDNIAASWLRATTTVANYDKAKALHKYTVEWNTGFIWTYIDDKLVDSRKYGGRLPFYLNYFKAHITSGYGLHEEYGVMFGAQCDNEAAWEAGCLDLIPGGTMEQEGYTGVLNTRNKGTYALLNSKDAWTLEKAAFWKTIMLDSNSLPVLGNFKEMQTNLVEMEKKAVGYRSNVYNNANKV
jgi:hypothetical protein